VLARASGGSKDWKTSATEPALPLIALTSKRYSPPRSARGVKASSVEPEMVAAHLGPADRGKRAYRGEVLGLESGLRSSQPDPREGDPSAKRDGQRERRADDLAAPFAVRPIQHDPSPAERDHRQR
jgi:hypothetical protein